MSIFLNVKINEIKNECFIQKIDTQAVTERIAMMRIYILKIVLAGPLFGFVFRIQHQKRDIQLVVVPLSI